MVIPLPRFTSNKIKQIHGESPKAIKIKRSRDVVYVNRGDSGKSQISTFVLAGVV
jgi:hypothetical protein